MIEIYGKDGCSKCQMVKSIFDKKGIAYIYKSIDKMDNIEDIREMVMKQNDGMYPLILKDGNVVSFKDVIIIEG
jgi:glutaredoxin